MISGVNRQKPRQHGISTGHDGIVTVYGCSRMNSGLLPGSFWGRGLNVAKLRGNPTTLWRLMYVLALLAIPILVSG